MPVGLRGLLPQHEVVHARDAGWSRLSNGDLLAAAEREQFDVMVTADQNIRYQQILPGRRIGLVIVSTSSWQVVRAHGQDIAAALKQVSQGSYCEVALPRSPLLRRPPPDFGR